MDENYQDGITRDQPVSTETKEETDKKCPACGGVLDFNPTKGKMVCPYCDSEYEIEVENPDFEAEELDFESAENSACYDWKLETKSVVCKSCGAETIYEAHEIANECPYCGSNQVMEAGAEHIMAPGGVVVFKLDANKASELFQSWIKHKFFCPKLAKESAKPKAFKGLYLPFWTFDCKTISSYTGQYGVKKRTAGNNSDIKWYKTMGIYKHNFDDVLICGSKKQNTSMLNGLEPFNTKDVVEYKPEYLAGFMAERYTLKMHDAWERAKNKMSQILHQRIKDEIRREHRTDYVRGVLHSTTHQNITYKYLLLPVWTSSFTYNGKIYQFMVNGQTGKVSGKTPISWVKVAFTVVAVIAIMTLLNFISG